MHMNLRVRITVLTISGMVVLSAMVILVNGFISYDANLKTKKAEYANLTLTISERYQAWLGQYKQLGESYTRNPAVQSANLAGIVDWLKTEVPQIREADPQVNNVVFVDSDGQGFFFDGAVRRSNIDDEAQALADGQFRIGKPLLSPSTGKPIVALYIPFKAQDGLIRLIIISLKLENILDLTKTYLDGSAYAILVDGQGTFLGHPDKNMILKYTLEGLAKAKASSSLEVLGKRILDGGSGVETFSMAGVDKLMAFGPVNGLAWHVAVIDDLDSITQEVRQDGLSLAFTLFLAMIAVIVATLPFIYLTTRGIRHFSHELKNVLGDDSMKGDLTRTIQIASRDEMGMAARYFNTFTQDLRDILLVVQKELGELGGRGFTLASNMEETASSIIQINSNLNSIDQQMSQFYNRINETDGVVEQIGASIEASSREIDHQTGAISQASTAVEEMVANLASIMGNITKLGSVVANLNSLSETGSGKLKDMIQSVNTVAEKSAALSETNAVINSIASQTNLLAMNAAIEAAHAGESGKGFAVVADEIRKLAEMSAQQSHEIGSQLKDMANAIDTIVRSSSLTEHAMDDMISFIGQVSTMEKEVRSAIAEQDAGSAQILDSLNGMKKATSEVTDKTQRVQELRKAIMERMKSLKELAANLDQALKEISAGTREINVAVSTVDELAQQNKESIKSVATALGQIKMD